MIPLISIAFEPRDLWIGIYWTRYVDGGELLETVIYVCLFPMLPIKLVFSKDVSDETWIEDHRGRPVRVE